ncbi:M55 family metallopeptidase [Acidisoma silvae]|uniref:M55 family metallopeptidase n=1 Tax=Acidisoma silvae TaxID=2802396 RepID=A0A964E1D9_9PROT|nr:M55 family metallopeptidase [Acidisoma silvae]MCB8878129.1 M55 family metallopeptidase [Acidisoma silvae]
MKIFISVDIEGVAGVVVPKQGQPGNLEYEDSRRLMTEEANAAIAGAFAGGASEVLVNDSHGPMVNLIPDLLDQRAELIRGQIKPGSMFAGLDDTYAGVMCVGYHAVAADYGVLAHTYSTRDFSAVRLNGLVASEAMLFGAYAGAMGVPVILLSGDDVTARSCGTLFPGAEIVTVKTALGQRAAKALSPQMARTRIQNAAERAVRQVAHIKPFTVSEPCTLELDLTSAVLADLCETIPLAQRRSALTVGFTAETVSDANRWVAVCCMLGSHLS